MNQSLAKYHLVLVDRQAYWRAFAMTTLERAGYVVHAFERYSDALQHCSAIERPGSCLVIVGCARVDVEERLFVTGCLERKLHLLILSASISTQDMRKLFLKGVDDATDKIYEAATLITTVVHILERITSREAQPHFLESEG